MNNTEKVLRYMKKLIAKGWTRKTFARTVNGAKVAPTDHRAARFCLLGARDCAEAALGIWDDEAMTPISECIGDVHIARYNDAPGRKKSDILKVIDCAIKKAKTA